MNLERLLARRFPVVEQTLTDRDAMIYALGIGAGDDSTDPTALMYCYEQGLHVFPAMVNVLAQPVGWIKEPELGIDYSRVVHGEQSFEIHSPLVPGATYQAQTRIVDVVDKGAGKGAVLFIEKLLRNKASNQLTGTVASTYFLRGNGGSGGTTTKMVSVQAPPDRVADGTVALATQRNAALLYRLSGDYNPLHVDPQVALKAGFTKPILHGLCTMGVVARALIDHCCNGMPGRLLSMGVRFSAPVYPGETIETAIWTDFEGDVRFTSRVVERGVAVLTNGSARVTHQTHQILAPDMD